MTVFQCVAVELDSGKMDTQGRGVQFFVRGREICLSV